MASMKRTMLEMVSDICEEIEADPVNDLDDSEESIRVTKLLMNTYWDMIANRMIPEHKELFRLTALADVTRPTTLQFPDLMKKLDWFKYDINTSGTKIEYSEVKWMEPQDFIEMLNARDSSASDVTTALSVGNSVDLLVYNDKMPDYWTTFDNDYVVCDSFDSSVENTLQQSNTQCYGWVYPTITRANATIIDLQETQLQFLYNETLAKASLKLIEDEDPHANKWAKRHRSSLQSTKYREGDKVWRRRYGRHG